MVYWLIKFFSSLFFKCYLGITVSGRGHVPRYGAYIVAANHASYLDPLILAAVFQSPLHFLTRDKVLSAPILGRVLRHANTISVKRQGRDIGAVKKSLKVLEKGRVLAIFPEGTRSRTGRLKRAKPGVGLLVFKAKVPVVPVYIEGSFQAQPRGIKTLRRHPIRVYIGRPAYYHRKQEGRRGGERYQVIGDEIMRHIAALERKK